MSGTLVTTYSESRIIQKVNFNWTSNASGDCSGDSKRVSGKILRATFIPSGSAVPTDGYTARINDNDGMDVLMGYGAAGLSATITRTIIPMVNDAVLGQPSYPIAVDGLLSLVVAGAGNVRSGVVSLYIER